MRQHLNAQSKKNEIRLLFKHPLYKDKAFLVVEGGSDIRLFRSLICASKIKIESVQGKQELAEIVTDLRAENLSIFGLRDADFDRVNGVGLPPDSIFITDEHDAEIMMLRSAALENVIDEYASEESLCSIKTSLREAIFEAGYILGAFRLANELDELKLKFRSISFRGFCSASRCAVTLDREALANQLIARSPNSPEGYTAEMLIQRAEEVENQGHCKFQLCCGHDLTKMIELIFMQTWASPENNLNAKKIESALRLSFSVTHFEATELYKSLKEGMSSIGDVFSSKNTMQSTGYGGG